MARRKINKRPGGSNAGKYPKVKSFAGPSGGAPSGSYPINTIERGRSALKLAHNAPNPSGIKQAVYRKYPSLKKQKGGPLKQLNDMQFARRGKAVGSMLEGGRIKYASGGPGPISPGKEMFDKIQQYAQNYNTYNQYSPHGLRNKFKKQLRRGEISQKKVDELVEINKLNLPWTKDDPNNPGKKIKVFKGGW